MLVVTTRRALWLMLSACVATGILAFAGAAQAQILNADPQVIGVDEFTIDASASAGGAIDPSGLITVALGDPQAFTITPTADYHVADVLVDGSSVGAVTSYTFNNVTADHTISATFAIERYTITSTAGARISPPGHQPSTPAAVQLRDHPDAHYHVADVHGRRLPPTVQNP